MKIIETKEELRQYIRQSRRSGQSIGFVPTMGYLHEGHLSLMRRARSENDLLVTSVFVNPAQFGPKEDLEAYPRDGERDKALMVGEKVDAAYFPTTEQIYPPGYTTYVDVRGQLTKGLCGRSRPRFFRGVATVVTKLFHLVEPDRAYFGQKDAQQAIVIRQMVRDLDFGIDIIVCPTVRESDGLAMSSRNAYLSDRLRADATVLYKSLNQARENIAKGERSAEAISRQIRSQIEKVQDAVIDYIEIVDAKTLEKVKTLQDETLIALAVKLGNTRLIDNITVEIHGTGSGQTLS